MGGFRSCSFVGRGQVPAQPWRRTPSWHCRKALSARPRATVAARLVRASACRSAAEAIPLAARRLRTGARLPALVSTAEQQTRPVGKTAKDEDTLKPAPGTLASARIAGKMAGYAQRGQALSSGTARRKAAPPPGGRLPSQHGESKSIFRGNSLRNPLAHAHCLMYIAAILHFSWSCHEQKRTGQGSGGSGQHFSG